MKVYFSHGKESGPWGSKIKRLAAVAEEQGFEVESIDYTAIPDPDDRVTHLLSRLEGEKEEFLLVGSSMGGYVSLVASGQCDPKGIFLMAPALYMPGYEDQTYPTTHRNVVIVHGWSDDVVLPEQSIRFAKEADCTLHLISGDHRLNDSIETVVSLFRKFLLASGEKGSVPFSLLHDGNYPAL